AELGFEYLLDAVEAAGAGAGEVKRGFAQCLGGKGAGVDAGAADGVGALDDGDAPALGGDVLGTAGAGRAGADDDQVEGVSFREHVTPRQSTPRPSADAP